MKKLFPIILIAICIFCNLPTYAYTPTCMSLGSLPYGGDWVVGEPADPDEVKGNDDSVRNVADTVCGTDLPLLPGKASTETITGAWTFTPAITCNGGVTYGSGHGTNNTSHIVDADNAGPEANQCYAFNRGSTSANDPAVKWNTATGTVDVVDNCSGSTLQDFRTGDGDTTGEVVTYDQVPKLTTTNELTMVNNFDVAPTSDVDATATNELARFGQLSGLSAGTCTISGMAPSGACTNGACHWDTTTSTSPILYVCAGADSMTWTKLDIDSIRTTNPIITSTDVDFTGAPPASTTDSLIGLGSDIASGDASGTYLGINAAMGYAGNLADLQVDGVSKFKISETGAVTVTDTITGITPTAAAHLTTKDYVDTSIQVDPLFNSTATVSVTSGTAMTLIGTGSGSLTIGADTLAVGNRIHIHAKGYVSNAGSDDAQITFFLGSTQLVGTLAVTTTAADAATNKYFEIDGDVTIRTIGMTGTTVSQLRYLQQTDTSTQLSFLQASAETGTQTLDTTASNALDLKWAWVAAAGADIMCTNFSAELYKY